MGLISRLKPFHLATKSKVLVTSPGHGLNSKKQMMLQLMKSHGDMILFHDLASKVEYYGLRGFVCEYFDTRAASNLVTNLNGSIIDVC